MPGWRRLPSRSADADVLIVPIAGAFTGLNLRRAPIRIDSSPLLYTRRVRRGLARTASLSLEARAADDALERLQRRRIDSKPASEPMVPDCARIPALPVLIALLATAALAPGHQPKQLAITFDDLPFGYPRHLTIAEPREAVARVLATR